VATHARCSSARNADPLDSSRRRVNVSIITPTNRFNVRKLQTKITARKYSPACHTRTHGRRGRQRPQGQRARSHLWVCVAPRAAVHTRVVDARVHDLSPQAQSGQLEYGLRAMVSMLVALGSAGATQQTTNHKGVRKIIKVVRRRLPVAGDDCRRVEHRGVERADAVNTEKHLWIVAGVELAGEQIDAQDAEREPEHAAEHEHVSDGGHGAVERGEDRADLRRADHDAHGPDRSQRANDCNALRVSPWSPPSRATAEAHTGNTMLSSDPTTTSASAMFQGSLKKAASPCHAPRATSLSAISAVKMPTNTSSESVTSDSTASLLHARTKNVLTVRSHNQRCMPPHCLLEAESSASSTQLAPITAMMNHSKGRECTRPQQKRRSGLVAEKQRRE
jgi:hypothetical protein